MTHSLAASPLRLFTHPLFPPGVDSFATSHSFLTDHNALQIWVNNGGSKRIGDWYDVIA